MGAVYKARERQLDRMVALKILPPEIGRQETFAQRFAREAQSMARLSHPNIVTIHSFGQRGAAEPAAGGEIYFFIMEYVDGLSLRQLLDAARSAPRKHWPSCRRYAKPSNMRMTGALSTVISSRRTSCSIVPGR